MKYLSILFPTVVAWDKKKKKGGEGGEEEAHEPLHFFLSFFLFSLIQWKASN